MEVVLAEWLFESIQDFHVLTLDKRYFDIPGSVERWLYLYAKKATGGPNGLWKESFRGLHKKSASQQAYKHYAHTLRKLVEKNDLPGLRLGRKTSTTGQEMLVMERTEKRHSSAAKTEPEQLPLLEISPLDEAWENVFEVMSKQLGTATANSWIKPLKVTGLEAGTLTLRAPTKFIGDTVASQFDHKLKAAWRSLGHDVTAVQIETQKSKSAA